MALKLCNVPRKLLNFSLNKALRTTREIASQFSLSFFVLLDVRLFSAGTSRILVHALHATRLGRTNFSHAMDFFSVTVWNLWIFARSIGLKTLCSSVVSMKSSAARRPEAFLPNCHAYSTLPLNFSHFRFGLPVHRSDGASKHTFCRIHKKMDLCNYHSGQHCGWDCFQMDCLLRPSSRTFPPIICLSTFRWNLRLLDSLIL